MEAGELRVTPAAEVSASAAGTKRKADPERSEALARHLRKLADALEAE